MKSTPAQIFITFLLCTAGLFICPAMLYAEDTISLVDEEEIEESNVSELINTEEEEDVENEEKTEENFEYSSNTSEIEPEVYINEIYPSPNTGEKEFVELYVEDPTNFNLGDYRIKDETTTTKSILSAVWNENLLLIEINGYYLNEKFDKAYLLETTSGEVIDAVCYGNVADISDCDSVITGYPAKGFSISYFADIEEFRFASPTPGEKNEYVNIDFLLQDINDQIKTSFVKGETIYILDSSEILGIEDFEISWFLKGEKITTIEIDTSKLELGEHSIQAIFEDNERTINFNVIEDFNGLVISEVFPNPAGKDETGISEWLEIHNSSSREINIQGLIISNGTSHFVITEDHILSPKQYFQVFVNFSLVNENGKLFLLTQNEIKLSTFLYDMKVGDDESVILIDGKIKLTTTPTQNSKNIFTPKVVEDDIPDTDNPATERQAITVVDFSEIEISEIFPNPKGIDEKGVTEWIELYNKSTETVNLKSLIIAQTTSKTVKYLIDDDLFISPKSFLIIYLDFSINNTAATFQLLNSSENLFDEVSYSGGVKEETSLIRQNGNKELIVTKTPTPNGINVQSGDVLSATEVEELPISEVKSLPENSSVKITGSTTVEAGKLGNEIFYIQDETGGIQIDLNGQTVNFLQKDSVITLEGRLKLYHEELKLIVSKNTITPINQAVNIQPIPVQIGKIDIDLVGSLITIKGYVSKTSGNTFYVYDQSGTIKVQIKETTGIVRPDCRKDYYAKITGILSIWDNDENGEPNYRLLPRYQDDIFISKTLARTGSETIFGFLFGICFFSISTINLYRNKGQKL